MSTMTSDEARAVATDWHGGQFTGLYALASSGKPYLWENRCHRCGIDSTMREVRDALSVADTHDQPHLQRLLAWLNLHRTTTPCTCDDEGTTR